MRQQRKKTPVKARNIKFAAVFLNQPLHMEPLFTAEIIINGQNQHFDVSFTTSNTIFSLPNLQARHLQSAAAKTNGR
jgi:hypothetical protein